MLRPSTGPMMTLTAFVGVGCLTNSSARSDSRDGIAVDTADAYDAGYAQGKADAAAEIQAAVDAAIDAKLADYEKKADVTGDIDAHLPGAKELVALAVVGNDGAGPSVTFSGVNVYINSGLGEADGIAGDGTYLNDTPVLNGLGNLTIGYNDGHTASPSDGTNNLILGIGNSFGGYGGIVNGVGNSIDGISSSVLSGSGNSATGQGSAIVGGQGNTVDGYYSAVGGGNINHAYGDVNVVAGGSGNTTTSTAGSSIISGGYNNTISGSFGTIYAAGGQTLSASYAYVP